jgi:hypothetical protein
MKISAENFVNNAGTYLDIFHLWLAWKGAPPFVQSAIAILEKALEFPMASNLLIAALKNVPGFEGGTLGTNDTPVGSLPDGLESFAGLQGDMYQVSKNIINAE